MLLLWVVLVAYLGWRYLTQRANWTAQRLTMSEQLLESMVGHRTRLVQQPEEEWHRCEDKALDQFIAKGDLMDRASLWLMLVPRGWLLVALAALIPAIAGNATSGSLAVSIGGSLLAYRALQRLVGGLSSLTGALISARSVAELVRAASRKEQAGLPSAILPSPHQAAARDGFVVQARDLT